MEGILLELVLYEISMFKGVSICIVLFVFLLMIFNWKRFVTWYYLKYHVKIEIEKYITINQPNMIKAFFCLLLLIAVFKVSGDIWNYYIPYHMGEYMVSEGFVEDYSCTIGRPYTYTETYMVGSAKFEYCNYNSTMTYHMTSKNRSGVIYGEGQYVKIGYIPKAGKNWIVYIAEIDPPPNPKKVLE